MCLVCSRALTIIHCVLYIEWTLVSENLECGGSEIRKELIPNAEVQDCARECEGVSSMFIFAPELNACYCETSATPEGTCDVVDIQGYHLYKYNNLGRLLII